ncbi:MAG: TraB/GumN family protein [Woeseiaceae bacterium]|nr:TraB/GumN family protein [Woeseiaceae bacterium]
MRTLTLLLILCAAPALAETHPVTMWRIDGAANSIYLLGSIHLLREQDHPLPSVIDTAYEDAEVVVMELDMDDLDPVYTQAAFNKAGVLRDGRTLQDLMGDELYAEAEVAAEVVDIPLDLLAQSEPWLAAMTVELMALYRIGFNPMYGVEMTMTSRAAADGKPIEGLETVEEQLSFLDGLPLDVQNEMLLQALRESASLREQIDELIVAWRHGDIETLNNGLLESIARESELHDVLIVNRNRRWVDAILEWLDDEQDYLIVVGALHLVGDDGVPALLEERGIGIHQLSEPAAVR